MSDVVTTASYGITDLVSGEAIDKFEELLSSMPNQVAIADMDVRHYMTDTGLYAREMLIPAGTLITGRVKKHEHISVIAAGAVTEITEAGRQNVKAPYIMVSQPNTKRIVLAHTDTVWVTIHATKETELDKIEEDLIVTSYRRDL